MTEQLPPRESKRPRLIQVAKAPECCGSSPIGMAQIAMYAEQLRVEFEHGRLSHARPSEPRPSLSELCLNMSPGLDVDARPRPLLLPMKAEDCCNASSDLDLVGAFPCRPAWLSESDPAVATLTPSPRWIFDSGDDAAARAASR